MKLYQVMAAVTRVTANKWRTRIDLPTFYLRDDMQGIANEHHADQIARHMLLALAPDAVELHVSVSVSTDFDPAVIGA